MEQQKFIKLLKQIVREELRSVIKEELTEILQEGLQSTINEMATSNVTKKSVRNEAAVSRKPIVKNKVEFGKNKFSDILNETESLKEQNPIAMNSSYAELMTEDISMTSADALNFGAQRKMQQGMSMHPAMQAPSVITDPETGKNMTVDPIVAKAMTRDYSALMKAMDAKKNR
jgi:hypothetical protein